MTAAVNPIRTYITGQTGRLGSVIVRSLWDRGDNITSSPDDVNYMVFAHRYRGPVSFDDEMMVNVRDVVNAIDHAKWADGDRAIVIVSSASSVEPALHQTLAYNCSKAALDMLPKYYAGKLSARINTVNPNTFTGEGAVITPQQVANVIAFLCSPQSSGLNGINIRIG